MLILKIIIYINIKKYINNNYAVIMGIEINSKKQNKISLFHQNN